jgi:hypothetical protein
MFRSVIFGDREQRGETGQIGSVVKGFGVNGDIVIRFNHA